METFRSLADFFRPSSPQRPANDVAAPACSARPIRSPTQRRRDPSDTAIDLTFLASSDAHSTPLDSNANTKSWTGDLSDIRRLVRGKYVAPADAVAAPNPGRSPTDRSAKTQSMRKPGAELSYKPVNSLDRNPSRNTTYGKLRTAKPFDFLDEDPNSFFSTGNHSPIPPPEPARKRRKVESLHASAQLGKHDRDLASGDAGKHMSFSTWPPSRRDTGTPSTHSDEGERKRHDSTGSLLSRNEYNSTERLVNPRAKSKASRLPRDSPIVYQNGAKVTDPIVLDEESFSHSTSGGQGAGSVSDRKPSSTSTGTTSPYFFNSKAKISQPTGHVPLPLDREYDSTQLRKRFKRIEQASLEETSEDELAPAPVLKRSSRSRAMTDHAQTRQSSSGGFELEFARTPDFEGHGPGLSLRPEKEHSYRIARHGVEGIKTTSVIPFAKINTAYTDDKSRILLKGPINADKSQLIAHLQFKSRKELHTFRDKVSASITERRLSFKDETDMAYIFQKGLTPIGKPSPTSSRGSKNVSSANASRGGLLALNEQSQTIDKHKTGSDNADAPAQKSRTGPDILGRLTRATRSHKPTYVEVEEETDIAPLRYSEVHGLGPPWQHQLTFGTGRHRATVDFSDLLRLDEGEFLNDQLIDFYLLWLFKQTEGLSDKVYIFNTHFFSTLTRKVPGQKTLINYPAVARWTAKEDLFGYDYIVVPINQDVHWYVAIICNVSSIARKPAIDVTQSPAQPQTQASKDAPPVEERSTPTLQATEPSSTAPLAITKPASDDNDKTLFDEAPESCGVNIVDTHVTKPISGLEKGAETVAIDSDASETVRMRQLTLAEATRNKGRSLSNSPSSSKKPRRKSGPPVKRWNPDEPTIIILDSLGGTARSQAVRALKDYLRAEGVAKRGMEAEIPQNAFYAKDTHIPLQENFYDCGVYLLGYMQKFFQDPDKFKKELLLGEMQAKSSWPEKSIPQIRDLMRDILRDLYQSQEQERRRAKAEKRGRKSGTTAHGADPVNENKSESSKYATTKEPEGPPSEPLLVGSSIEEKPKRLSSPFEPVAERSERRTNSPAPIIKVDDSPVPPLHDAERREDDGYQVQSDHKPGGDCEPDTSSVAEHDRQPDPTQGPHDVVADVPRVRKPSPAVVVRSPKRPHERTGLATNGVVETIEARGSPPKRQKLQSNQGHGVGFTGSVPNLSANKSAKRPFPQVAPEDLVEDDHEDAGTSASLPGSRGSPLNPISIDDNISEEIAICHSVSGLGDRDDATPQASRSPIPTPGQIMPCAQAPTIEPDKQLVPTDARMDEDNVQSEPFVGDRLGAALRLAQESLERSDRKSKSVEENESQTTVEDLFWTGVSTPGARRRRDDSPDELPSRRRSEVAETPPARRWSPEAGATSDNPLEIET